MEEWQAKRQRGMEEGGREGKNVELAIPVTVNPYEMMRQWPKNDNDDGMGR